MTVRETSGYTENRVDVKVSLINTNTQNKLLWSARTFPHSCECDSPYHLFENKYKWRKKNAFVKDGGKSPMESVGSNDVEKG